MSGGVISEEVFINEEKPVDVVVDKEGEFQKEPADIKKANVSPFLVDCIKAYHNDHPYNNKPIYGDEKNIR